MNNVKFEFTLSSKDATNLMDVIYREICKCYCSADDITLSDAERGWYSSHAEYLKGIKDKMASNMIEDK